MIPISILAIENDDDREFMAKLFETYQRLMYQEIHQIAKDPWLTEDVLHATIVKLIDKISLLRTLSEARKVNYIISACKNTAINEGKKRERTLGISFDDLWDSETTYCDDNVEKWIDKIEKEDSLECLHRIWPKLSKRSQYLLEGKYILQKTDKEMAEDLGIQPSSIRMLLTRARKEAKKLMLEELNPVP